MTEEGNGTGTKTAAGTVAENNGTMKILMVDDEPDLKPLVRQRLRPEIRAGKYTFVFAGDGAEAMEQLAQHGDIDMVISDINMPRMDGLALLERVSSHNPEIRSIIVSAYGDMLNIRKAMNRGAFDFITKPMDFEDLRITIERTRENLLAWRRAMESRNKLQELQQELDVASRMQRAILPTSFPSGPGYDIHGSMTPAHDVSGDFFDVIQLDGERTGLAIADVSGKGVPAALFMMSSRTLLKGAAIGLDSPGQVLEEVNNLLYRDNENTMFITLLYAIYDPHLGTLTYANGGHCPPMLLDPSGECRELPSTRGIALGLTPNRVYRETLTEVPPGSTVVMYTDGVSEAMNADREEFGEERLEGVLRSGPALGAAETNRRIIQAIHDFTLGMRQSDDITCLTLHRRTGAQ